MTAVFVLGTVTTAAVVALQVATSQGERAPRLTDLSLRGRADAWSAAWTLSRRDLLLGNGVGSFARQWPVLRPPTGPHILQPHSVELEQLAELGALGLALFVGSWLLLFRCARGRDRPLSVAAQCVAAVLVIQASVDWTWSFPGLVAAVMLVLGLAAGGSRQSARARPATEAAVVGLAVAALGIFAVPYLSDRALAQASGNQSSRPATALAQARSAIRLYPWDQRAYALEGSILGSAGDYTAAANAYAEAASRALEPWVQHLDEARTAVQAKRIPLARTACEAALRENPYAVDAVLALCPRPDGRAWPLAAVPAARVAPPFARLLVSRGCDGCRVTVAGGRVSARVAGGFPFEDTAVAVTPLPGAAGPRGVLHVQLQLALQRAPASHLVFLEVRDARQRLVFSLFVEGPSRQLMVYNPPGGFDSSSFVAPIGGIVPLGGPGVAVSVDLLRNTYAEFRVDGRLGLRFPGSARPTPSHALTGTPAQVEAGIDGYDSSRLDDPIEVTIRGLRAGVSPARRIGG